MKLDWNISNFIQNSSDNSGVKNAFNFIDKWIERKLKEHLHKKRKYYVYKSLVGFINRNPGHDYSEIRKKLETEAARIYPMVDRSILRERVKRAKYIFWATLAASLLVVGAVVAASGGTALALVAPVCASIVTWAASIATIPVSYNQRVKGAMDCVVIPYEECLKQNQKTKENKVNCEELFLYENQENCRDYAPLRPQGTIVFDVSKALVVRHPLSEKYSSNGEKPILGKYTANIIFQNHHDIGTHALPNL